MHLISAYCWELLFQYEPSVYPLFHRQFLEGGGTQKSSTNSSKNWNKCVALREESKAADITQITDPAYTMRLSSDANSTHMYLESAGTAIRSLNQSPCSGIGGPLIQTVWLASPAVQYHH